MRIGGFNAIPDVIKNLLIINGLMLLASLLTLAISDGQNNLIFSLGLYSMESPNFEPYQLVTHFFMHSISDPSHLLFNMFALWLFGSNLEQLWGGKKFLLYYLFTGYGTALIYGFVNYLIATFYLEPQLLDLGFSLSNLQEYIQTGGNHAPGNELLSAYLDKFNTPMVGASGALFGILLAYGMTFPNQIIHLFFMIPIKVKYLVAGYGALEFLNGIEADPSSNVAHFAHLSGLLIGFILLKLWKTDSYRQF